MSELGNRLKEARLAKGLSLEDVQTITKIQKRYLVGIEEGNYSGMPGNFYVRAFIKQYAESLGLNPEEIFETYKNEIPASYNEELPQKLSRVKTHKKISQSHSKIYDILPKILIAVFVISIASVIYYFYASKVGQDPNEQVSSENEPVKYVKSENLENAKEVEKEKSSSKEKEKVENQTKEEEKEQTSTQNVPTQELAVVTTSGRKTTYSLTNADKFIVKVVSKGESWINIRNGKGKSFYSGTLKAGETDSYTADLTGESEAIIVVGRTLDADIYVNDQKLEYQINPADKVRQDITIQFVPKNE
ncbi:helix-turn-helix domain-containing protein [Neobacillus thermocopriae]|uniref:helix-turn-helix domain-containing protein n=1 Tax=Neobacillus thermocopriae TaxID=1215031 RepID=UPI002E1F6EB3|nr:DUF4115 domain-containing protein [Neobacillus thermocopriae]MED3713612.1 DUF4115 domain-containing protein [Neobacillus thermocopriae]